MSLSKRKSIDHLSSIPLFSGLTNKELQLLRGLCQETSASAGKVICKQGSVGFELFVILSGTAKVEVDGVVITTLSEGSHFGEMALLDKGPRSAEVTAVSDMDLLVMGPREFSTALDKTPGLAAKLLATLARRLREADRRIVSH
jgi:CRP-like cAMP-binding protein